MGSECRTWIEGGHAGSRGAQRTRMVVKMQRPLAGLDGAGGEGAAVAHLFDVEEDGQVAGAGEQEVAVAAVHEEVVGHGLGGRRQRHGDDGAAVDAARARRVPGLARVSEDVLEGAVRGLRVSLVPRVTRGSVRMVRYVRALGRTAP